MAAPFIHRFEPGTADWWRETAREETAAAVMEACARMLRARSPTFGFVVV
jgi:hypothetical protein